MMAMLEKPCFAGVMAQRMTIDGGTEESFRPRLNIREKRVGVSTFATFTPVKG